MKRLDRSETPSGTEELSGSGLFTLAAGDKLDVRAYQDTGSDKTTEAAAISNWVDIIRLADDTTPPAAFSGPGWPITLRSSLPAVKLVVLLRAEDQTNGAVITSSPGIPAWYPKDVSTPVITRVSDLTAGKTYKLTFLLA